MGAEDGIDGGGAAPAPRATAGAPESRPQQQEPLVSQSLRERPARCTLTILNPPRVVQPRALYILYTAL